MTKNLKLLPPLQAALKRKFMRITYNLWQFGAEHMHKEHPSVSVIQWQNANKYYNSLRCEGCHCGSCINLPVLAADLNNAPAALKPLADLTVRLVAQEEGIK